jgi:hypothetical protein
VVALEHSAVDSARRAAAPMSHHREAATSNTSRKRIRLPMAPEMQHSSVIRSLLHATARRWESIMSTVVIIGISVLALATAGVGVWYAVARRRQTQSLHEQYGSEYDRTVARAPSRRAAEAELVKRQERVDQFNIRPLTAEQLDVFSQQWHDVQEAFVDNPGRAVSKADGLVVEVMRERGYPVTNFEQRASDLSVNHASFVHSYRVAREIAARHRRGAATTEELRRAMVYYREMFDDLLERDEPVSDRQVSRAVERDVPLPSERTTSAAEGRIRQQPIAPLRSDRGVP